MSVRNCVVDPANGSVVQKGCLSQTGGLSLAVAAAAASTAAGRDSGQHPQSLSVALCNV